MHSNIDTLFSNMWDDYVTITPSAHKIHALLAGEENTTSFSLLSSRQVSAARVRAACSCQPTPKATRSLLALSK